MNAFKKESDSRDCDSLNDENRRNFGGEHSELVCSDSTAKVQEKDFLQGFLDLYEDLYNFLKLNISLSTGAIKRSTKHLVCNYANLTSGKTPEELDFNDINICLGYLHRYGMCHTALVYQVMIKVIEQSTAVKSILSGKKMNLVCLGGGPGNDFIGLIFALFSCRISVTDLDVTVVDKASGWKIIFKKTIEMLTSMECAESGKMSFVEADLLRSVTWNNTMKHKLRGACIITLVKVLSNISKTDHFGMLKNIIRYMEDDALLILIDCPLPFFELDRLSNFLHLVYKSEKQKFNLGKTKTRFGYPNITKCSAYVRVYKKKNSFAIRGE